MDDELTILRQSVRRGFSNRIVSRAESDSPVSAPDNDITKVDRARRQGHGRILGDRIHGCQPQRSSIDWSLSKCNPDNLVSAGIA